MRRVAHFINGRLRDDGESCGELFNPATGEVVGEVPCAQPSLIDEVVSAAHDAQRIWALTALSTRTSVMFAVRNIVQDHANELARIISSEHGKTLADARGEIARGVENLEYACGLEQHLKGDFSSQVSDGVDVYSLREPVGVVAAITPFNFPAMVPLWMSANALASGNAVIVKPSERDPSVCVRLAELFLDAGLAPGLFNVVHGDHRVVDALLIHGGVDAVSFVGSTPVARSIYQKAVASDKRVQALGGAKNHMVVMADADLDVAADAALGAAFGSAGQRCMAISVLVVINEIADALVGRIVQRMDALRVGPSTDLANDIGPLITRTHRDRVARYVAEAPDSGATVVRDGGDMSARAGFFFGPTLLDHVQPGMACYDDEIFGPVLCVVRVTSYAQAVEIVNSNHYGNGVAIFTGDGHTARRFSREVKVGMIGINVAIPVPVAAYSFGGWGDSLFGHAHMYGPEGFNFFTRAKVVTTRWPQPNESRIDLGFPVTR